MNRTWCVPNAGYFGRQPGYGSRLSAVGPNPTIKNLVWRERRPHCAPGDWPAQPVPTCTHTHTHAHTHTHTKHSACNTQLTLPGHTAKDKTYASVGSMERRRMALVGISSSSSLASPSTVSEAKRPVKSAPLASSERRGPTATEDKEPETLSAVTTSPQAA
jgi:hypothetical protein